MQYAGYYTFAACSIGGADTSYYVIVDHSAMYIQIPTVCALVLLNQSLTRI